MKRGNEDTFHLDVKDFSPPPLPVPADLAECGFIFGVRQYLLKPRSEAGGSDELKWYVFIIIRFSLISELLSA